MHNYDDIINITYVKSNKFKPMPIENRAAQFAPFSALKSESNYSFDEEIIIQNEESEE